MKGLGIAVAMKAGKKPMATAVMLDDSSGQTLIVDVLERPGGDADMAMLLADLHAAIFSHVKGLGPDRVVVRRADFSPTASRSDARSMRLMMEGAITSAARALVTDTHLLTGKEVGSRCGNDKNQVDADAKALLTASGRPARLAEATAAAMSALA